MILRRLHLKNAPIAGLLRLARWLRCESIPGTDDEAARDHLVEIVARRLRFHGRFQDW